MKKWVLGAIAVSLCGCYTPLNNSGVSTTKPWLEIPAKRVDFDGKQYDSCVQFKLRFWPPEAVEELDLQQVCISACCWRSERSEIVLDFNQHKEQNLAQYGIARIYTPGKITLQVSHSNLVNVTRVSISPRGAISNSGLVKLSYKTVEDKARLAQLAQERQTTSLLPMEKPPRSSHVAPASTSISTPQISNEQIYVKSLVWRIYGEKIDRYFYHMNKLYVQKGSLFLLSTRLLNVQLQEDNTYRVTCHAKARTGIDEQHLNASDFPCGVWVVDVNAQRVSPHDNKARQIAQL